MASSGCVGPNQISRPHISIRHRWFAEACCHWRCSPVFRLERPWHCSASASLLGSVAHCGDWLATRTARPKRSRPLHAPCMPNPSLIYRPYAPHTRCHSPLLLPSPSHRPTSPLPRPAGMHLGEYLRRRSRGLLLPNPAETSRPPPSEGCPCIALCPPLRNTRTHTPQPTHPSKGPICRRGQRADGRRSKEAGVEESACVGCLLKDQLLCAFRH